MDLAEKLARAWVSVIRPDYVERFEDVAEEASHHAMAFMAMFATAFEHHLLNTSLDTPANMASPNNSQPVQAKGKRTVDPAATDSAVS